jgi:hypothetical protein
MSNAALREKGSETRAHRDLCEVRGGETLVIEPSVVGGMMMTLLLRDLPATRNMGR